MDDASGRRPLNVENEPETQRADAWLRVAEEAMASAYEGGPPVDPYERAQHLEAASRQLHDARVGAAQAREDAARRLAASR